MKRALTVFLALTLVLALAGCTASGLTGSTAPAPDRLKIGIVQIVDHPSLNTIRESFLQELAARGFTEDKVMIDYQNAQNDQSTLHSINQKFVADQVDLIVAIATPSAQSAAASTTDIPILFSAVTDPVAAKLMSDLNQPNRNLTGTSDAIPVNELFELSKQLTPDIQTYGFLYCSSEVSAMSIIGQAKEYCDDNGISYVEAAITNTSELQQAAQSLSGKCDAFYVSIDNTIASAMPTLVQVARDANIPLYVGADSLVLDGGLATVGIEYTGLGKQTAAMAEQILTGTPISEIPVEVLSNFGTMINEDTAAALGITIPEALLSKAQLVKTAAAQ